MIYIAVFIIGVLVGGGVAMFLLIPVVLKSWEGPHSSRKGKTSGIKAHTEKQQEIKEKRKKEILGLLQKQETVTNDDVERLLNVSDATVTNYLQELEEEGRVEQIGQEGRFVSYRLK